MGNCCSFGSSGYQPYSSSFSSGKQDGQIVSTWKQTGIVGLRDRGLKEIPENIQNVGADAKVTIREYWKPSSASVTSCSWFRWLRCEIYQFLVLHKSHAWGDRCHILFIATTATGVGYHKQQDREPPHDALRLIEPQPPRPLEQPHCDAPGTPRSITSTHAQDPHHW